MGTGRGVDTLTLSPSVFERLLEDCRSRAPKEACGVLTGRDGHAQTIVPLSNTDDSARTYLAGPRELFKALRDARREDRQLVAIYHSHPATRAWPSPTDVEQAYYPEAFYLVVSLADPAGAEVRAFRIRDGRVTQATVKEAGSPRAEEEAS